MKQVRQGQTRWQVVVYEPGKIEGYDDRHVAAVYRCFVTRVRGRTVYYQCEAGPYLCGISHFLHKHPSFRRAMMDARAKVDAINADILRRFGPSTSRNQREGRYIGKHYLRHRRATPYPRTAADQDYINSRPERAA